MTKKTFRSLNPYRKAVKIVKNRLVWDIDHRSCRSRARLKRLQGTRTGTKAVILCNGPTLNTVDFDSLTDVFTFGLNKINLLFERCEFRPHVIVAINPHVIQQNAAFFNSTKIPLFIDWRGRRFIQFRENVTFIHSGNLRDFAHDVSISYDPGYTVTYTAMQLAAHFGFSEVALVGCDHDFATKGPANAPVVSGETDPNHFDSRYFSGGVVWQLPDLIQSEISYLFAKQAFQNRGGRIVNCTNGGKLEVFPRMTLANFLAE